MNIVSYRGPGSGGGVSPTLSFLFDKQSTQNANWYFVEKSELKELGRLFKSAASVARLSPDVVDKHYRYCNEFLWPIMHDMPEYTVFRQTDRANYLALNRIVAAALTQSSSEWLFINDYQLAAVPALLASMNQSHAGTSSLCFWHIPWPKTVLPQHVQAISEIARGLIASKMLGFHTNEYAENFLQFVAQNLPEFRVSLKSRQIFPAGANSSNLSHFNVPDRIAYISDELTTPTTDILVAPLGLALDEWQAMAAKSESIASYPHFAQLTKTPFILSIDRADYTKGVKERIKAIETFFSQHSNWQGKVTFAQICTRTRPGLYAFDNYWLECRQMANELCDRLGNNDWQPLIWLESAASAEELACLYKHANAMLVSPVRDGLNLTAKEYIACQNGNPGILLLSSDAGAWHELRAGCLSVNPQDAEQMSHTIATALEMNEVDRLLRLNLMKKTLKENSLSRWWGKLRQAVAYKQIQESKTASAMFS
jgi:trehalose 6-phosphate synthase